MIHFAETPIPQGPNAMTIPHLEELLSRATPGPWVKTYGFIMRQESDECVCSLVNCDGQAWVNQELIIAMRNNIGALLAVAKAAQVVHEMDTATCGIREMGEALDRLTIALVKLQEVKK